METQIAGSINAAQTHKELVSEMALALILASAAVCSLTLSLRGDDGASIFLLGEAVVLGFSAIAAVRIALSVRSRRRATAVGRERMVEMAHLFGKRIKGDSLAIGNQDGDFVIPCAVHALNSPLGVILGSVYLLKKKASSDGALTQDLERVHDAARRCVEIAQDLRAYAETRAPARR